MININDVLKSERDINFSLLSTSQRKLYNEVKHKLVMSYHYLIQARDLFVSEVENFICNGTLPKKNMSECLRYYYYVSIYHKNYIEYSQYIYLLKRS